MFDRISIRYKLIVLLGLSAALALLISSAITIYSTYLSESRASLRVLHQLTDVISENMRAALAFGDAGSANTMLASLRADPHILLAVVNDESGRQLAEYRAARLSGALVSQLQNGVRARIVGHADALGRADGFVEHIDDDFMGVLRPVFFEGVPIGVLAVVSDTGVMWARIRELVLLQVVTSVLTLVLLLFLSVKLQSLFTRPIMKLVEAMQDVARTKHYRTDLKADRRDEFGTLYAGFHAMLADIRERDERLSLLATTDALTGLANRGHALETVHTMLTRAQRNHASIGVILFDVDHFKQVNDTYGHPGGDQVLRDIARIAQINVRPYDLAARFGGEEFLVLCDGADLPTTLEVAERIRASVASHVFGMADGRTLHASVSLGVCASTTGQAVAMIEAADQAMYRAKQAGRNHIESAQA